VPFDPSTLVLTGKRIMGSVMYRLILMSTILDFLVRSSRRQSRVQCWSRSNP
jgi:hypothetical protein